MAQGKTVIKVVTAMTTAQNPHGGQGATTYIDDALGRDKMHHQCIQIGSGKSIRNKRNCGPRWEND